MKKVFKGIKLNLQLFAGDPPTDPPADPNNTPPANPPAGDPKTFSQEEVNAIASKEVKKAQEKFLKSIGFEDFENAKDGIAKFKEYTESQKTEAQKQAEKLTGYETDINNYKNQIDSLNAQLSASKLGIKEESINDVVLLAKTLVNDETDLNTAMSKVLEKYPHFKGEGQQQQDPSKPSFTQGQHKKETPNEVDSWIEAFSKQIKK